jgi:hypothetical protein
MKMLIGIPNQLAAPLAGLDVATQADLKKKNIGYMSRKIYMMI